MKQLQSGNIAPVDLAQAAIEPGMAIFSKYSQVLDSAGQPMSIREALQAINAELDLYFFGADNRMDEASRFCLELYSQNAFNEIKFGEAEVLAKAKNRSVDSLVQLGLLSAEKGRVRLLTREELPSKPKSAQQASCVWLLTQYMVKALDLRDWGVRGCARMVKDFDAQAGHARELAYRLHAIAERNNWPKEALAYNSLVSF